MKVKRLASGSFLFLLLFVSASFVSIGYTAVVSGQERRAHTLASCSKEGPSTFY